MTTSDEKRVQDVIHGLAEVASARDAAGILDLLNRHPDLLTDTVNDVLMELVERFKNEDPQAAEFLEKAAAVLRSARARGIGDADLAGLASSRTLQDAIARANDRYKRWMTTGEDNDLDEALSEWERMLDIADQLTTPEEVGQLQAVMARLHMARYIRTGERDDLDKAMELAESALAHVPSGARGRLDIANTAGMVSRMRYQVTGLSEDLERAVAAFEEAANHVPADAAERLNFMDNLASALLDRATREGSLADLDRAVSCFRTAAQQTPKDSPEIPQRLANLATALVTLYQFTGASEPLGEGIDALQTATTMTQPGSLASIMTLTRLGEALRWRYDQTRDRATLERAIAVLERGVSETIDRGPLRAWSMSALGSTIIERYAYTRQAADLDYGTRLLTESAAYSSQGSPEAQASQHILATALARAYEADHDAHTQSRASEAYQEATASASTVAKRVHISDEWGRWAAKAGAWQDAASAYAAELDAWESAVRSREAGHPSFPGDVVATLPARAAYALAANADLDGAVLALERGRLLQGQHQVGSEQIVPPTRAEVAEATLDASIAYLLVTENGGLGIVISGTARETVQSVWLPEVDEASLRRHVVSYLSASERQRTLDELTNWLWPVVMGPVLAAVMPTSRLTLIPFGTLALLPLHAAWHQDERAATGRQYAIDESTIAYAPSVRVLLQARQRAAGKYPESILAVTNPGPASELLPGAAREGEMASRWFGRGTVLTGMAATRSAVLHAIDKYDVVHFACHGTSDLKDPDLNALMMADNDSLHPPDILQKDLGSTRLVVLSASETGLPGAEPAKESLGWPGSFLAAGAGGVIASLWGVPDATSMLLMARFYHVWHRDVSDPADALREAQQWLRDSTNSDKAYFFERNNIPFPKHLPAAAKRLWEEGRSDASPALWAGFVYFGA